MNLAQKKKLLGWKLNKEEKSLHACEIIPASAQVKHSHQKYALKNHGKIYGRRK